MSTLLNMVRRAEKSKTTDSQMIVVRVSNESQLVDFNVRWIKQEGHRSVGVLSHDSLKSLVPVSLSKRFNLDAAMVLIIDCDKDSAYKTVIYSAVEQVLHEAVKSEVNVTLNDLSIAELLDVTWHHVDVRRKIGTTFCQGVKIVVTCELDSEGDALDVSIKRLEDESSVNAVYERLKSLVFTTATPFHNLLVEFVDIPEHLRRFLIYDEGDKKFLRLPEGKSVECVIGDNAVKRNDSIYDSSICWYVTTIAKLSPLVREIRDIIHRERGRKSTKIKLFVDDKASIDSDTVVNWLPQPTSPDGIILVLYRIIEVYAGSHTAHVRDSSTVIKSAVSGVTIVVD